MSRRRLFLHIGCHKTGTTSIQHALANNLAALTDHGLTFFYENCQTGELQLPDLHSWINFVETDRIVPHGMHVLKPRKLAQKLAMISGDVVISSENFSFFFEQQYIDSLCDSLTSVFDDIQIICYLRRQDRHVVSHHQEGAKLYRKAEYDLFGHSTRAIPHYQLKHGLYLNYDHRIGMWAHAFGKSSINIRIFDRSVLKNGDTVADFFGLLGINEFKKLGDWNFSMGIFETKIGHLINGARLTHDDFLVRLCRRTLKDSRKIRPSRREAREYYAHFIDGNRALNAKFSVTSYDALFDQDFSDYPEDAADHWTENDANEVILSLLKIIDQHYAKLSADDLRDAALGIAGNKPEIAVKLMRLAHFLRPEGELIKRKLAELEDITDARE